MTAAPFSAEREEVAAAGRTLAEHGLVTGTAGNVSLRAGAGRAITPAGADLTEVRAQDIVVVTETGELLEGDGRPSSETPLHLSVDAPAIVHTHSHFATVLSCFNEDVLPVHYLMARFGGPLRVAPYATFGTPDLAAAATEGLRDRTAVLLANHGAVVVGETLSEALDRAALLESSCAIAYHARILGGPRVLSSVELAEVSGAETAASVGEQR
ncbi:MAG TPA: class II aldolase/adducin family protein [Solirubrobacterales bacterium]